MNFYFDLIQILMPFVQEAQEAAMNVRLARDILSLFVVPFEILSERRD